MTKPFRGRKIEIQREVQKEESTTMATESTTTEETTEISTEEGLECCVCENKNMNIRTTPCGHVICEGCYQSWFVTMNHRRCPMCNSQVQLDRIIKLFN